MTPLRRRSLLDKLIKKEKPDNFIPLVKGMLDRYCEGLRESIKGENQSLASVPWRWNSWCDANCFEERRGLVFELRAVRVATAVAALSFAAQSSRLAPPKQAQALEAAKYAVDTVELTIADIDAQVDEPIEQHFPWWLRRKSLAMLHTLFEGLSKEIVLMFETLDVVMRIDVHSRISTHFLCAGKGLQELLQQLRTYQRCPGLELLAGACAGKVILHRRWREVLYLHFFDTSKS